MPEGRKPKRPEVMEVASSAADGIRSQYIGELDYDPRRRARFSSQYWRDDATTMLLYRDVLADQRAGQALDQRLGAAVSKPWNVQAGGDRRIDRLAADDLKDQLSEIAFDAVSRKMLHAVWFGYSVAEILYAAGDRRVIVDSIKVRAPERFRWSADNEPRLKTLKVAEGIPLDERKFMVLTRQADNDDVPYAPGLARWCFWPSLLKRHGIRFWSTSLEKFATPTAQGKYPKGSTPEEIDKLVEVLQALAEGIAIAIPEGQIIDILESRQRAGGDYETFCKYMDSMITTSILGQSSTTDQGPWRGTAEIQMEVRDETVASDCKLLNEVLNKTIAKWLTDWNFPGAAYPVITREVESPEDLSKRAEREAVISRTTGLKPTQQHVEEVYGGQWEEATPAEPAGSFSDGSRRQIYRYAALDDDTIDTAAEDASADWVELLGPSVDRILDDAEHSDGYEEFERRIDGKDIPEEMNTESFESRMTNLGFSTDISGRAE